MATNYPAQQMMSAQHELRSRMLRELDKADIPFLVVPKAEPWTDEYLNEAFMLSNGRASRAVVQERLKVLYAEAWTDRNMMFHRARKPGWRSGIEDLCHATVSTTHYGAALWKNTNHLLSKQDLVKNIEATGHSRTTATNRLRGMIDTGLFTIVRGRSNSDPRGERTHLISLSHSSRWDRWREHVLRLALYYGMHCVNKGEMSEFHRNFFVSTLQYPQGMLDIVEEVYSEMPRFFDAGGHGDTERDQAINWLFKEGKTASGHTVRSPLSDVEKLVIAPVSKPGLAT